MILVFEWTVARPSRPACRAVSGVGGVAGGFGVVSCDVSRWVQGI